MPAAAVACAKRRAGASGDALDAEVDEMLCSS